MTPRLVLAVLFSLALAASAMAKTSSAPVGDEPYPGTLVLSVDATDIARRIFTVHQEIPVVAGELRLYYPKWLPGGHDPGGPIEQIGGLVFTVDGKVLPWRRDPLDMYSFLVDVPVGASKLLVDFQFLSPLDSAQGRIVVTPEIIGLQWNTVALYPAGYRTRRIMVQPNVKLPEGWKFGTALEVATQAGASTAFKPLDFETLIDSPLLAGKYFKRYDLDPGGKVPVHLDVVADQPKELEAKPEVLAKHRSIVQQAYKLFGSQHFAHYDFLLSISDRYSGIGLEHHQSSENGADPGYFDPKGKSDRDLLAHEFTHSWNGKFRRGADQATPDFNTPLQDSKLWLYEGQTQYWGDVLAVRSGMQTADKVRDGLAQTAAHYDHMEGRTWRNLQDTTNQPIISDRARQAWSNWQRGEDYYSEGQLIWLDADTLIREKSGGKKSLDDFARGFFGVENGRVEALPYVTEDVVAALNAVLPHDWAGFLRERLEGKGPRAPLDGLARAGWKLVYADEPGESGGGGWGGTTDFSYSLGLSLGKDMKLGRVLWNGPAFKAGLASSMTLVAVNGMAASADALKDAVIEAKKSGAPIVLLVNNLDHIDTVRIDYRGGLRYPKLERLPGTPDRLAAILAPRK